MEYFVYHLRCRPGEEEVLLAFLSELPFDSFAEAEHGWEAHLRSGADTEVVETQLGRLRERFDFDYRRETLPHQNWNAIWEAGFHPIRVGTFCGVRAPFHPPPTGLAVDLLISPRMAFGTGHHETTYLMIQEMEKLPLAGARVLDYGCGTGILAILAAKRGAAQVDAVDIEAEATANTLDNAQLNGVQLDQVITGQLADVPGTGYDIVLANINRNVILDSLPALYSRLKAGGRLLISGILQEDTAVVTDRAKTAGFEPEKVQQRGEWMCLSLSRD